MYALTADLHEWIAVVAVRKHRAAIERLAQWEQVLGPGGVAQPLALIGGVRGAHAEHIVCRALHPVRRREDVGDIGKSLACERERNHQQSRLHGQRCVHGISLFTIAVVGAPQRGQPSAFIAHLLAGRTPLLRVNASEPHRHRATQLLQLNLEIFKLHRKPFRCSHPSISAYQLRGLAVPVGKIRRNAENGEAAEH